MDLRVKAFIGPGGRRSKRAILCPVRVKAITHGKVESIMPFTVNNKWCLNALIGNHTITAAVTRLFRGRCPVAVARRIAFIVFTSFYGVFSTRALAHVGKEILKTGLPSLANRNSTTAVPGIHMIRRIIAPSQHVRPYPVLRRPCFAVCSMAFNAPLLSVATTRFSVSPGQIAPGNNARITALTGALPIMLSTFLSRVRDHGQAAKLQASDILKSGILGMGAIRSRGMVLIKHLTPLLRINVQAWHLAHSNRRASF